jgi:hypothetical protein
VAAIWIFSGPLAAWILAASAAGFVVGPAARRGRLWWRGVAALARCLGGFERRSGGFRRAAPAASMALRRFRARRRRLRARRHGFAAAAPSRPVACGASVGTTSCSGGSPLASMCARACSTPSASSGTVAVSSFTATPTLGNTWSTSAREHQRASSGHELQLYRIERD